MGGRESVDAKLKEAALGLGAAVVSIDYRLCPETALPELVADVCDGARAPRPASRTGDTCAPFIYPAPCARSSVDSGVFVVSGQPWPGSRRQGRRSSGPTPRVWSQQAAPPAATSH